MRIVTEVDISSGHKLPNYDGKCKNLHGHNWRVRVCLDGKRQLTGSQAGMLWDFSEVRKIVNGLDHVYLNDMISNPTAENISEWICKRLWDASPDGIKSIIVQVYETPKSYAQYNSEELPSEGNGELDEVLNDLDKEKEAEKDIGTQVDEEDVNDVSEAEDEDQ